VNSKGARTVPCGTPDNTYFASLLLISSATDCFLLDKKSLIQVSTCGHNPFLSNLKSNLRWGTLSKDFEKCKNKQSVFSPLLMILQRCLWHISVGFHKICPAKSHAVLHRQHSEPSSGLILSNKLYVQGVYSSHELMR